MRFGRPVHGNLFLWWLPSTTQRLTFESSGKHTVLRARVAGSWTNGGFLKLKLVSLESSRMYTQIWMIGHKHDQACGAFQEEAHILHVAKVAEFVWSLHFSILRGGYQHLLAEGHPFCATICFWYSFISKSFKIHWNSFVLDPNFLTFLPHPRPTPRKKLIRNDQPCSKYLHPDMSCDLPMSWFKRTIFIFRSSLLVSCVCSSFSSSEAGLLRCWRILHLHQSLFKIFQINLLGA